MLTWGGGDSRQWDQVEAAGGGLEGRAWTHSTVSTRHGPFLEVTHEIVTSDISAYLIKWAFKRPVKPGRPLHRPASAPARHTVHLDEPGVIAACAPRMRADQYKRPVRLRSASPVRLCHNAPPGLTAIANRCCAASASNSTGISQVMRRRDRSASPCSSASAGAANW